MIIYYKMNYTGYNEKYNLKRLSFVVYSQKPDIYKP
jgi:hypothetical protein